MGNFDTIKNILSNKQHADKIIEKIKEIDTEQSKRAIWELVQNARDVAQGENEQKKVNIEIELYDDYLIFKHDGKCFDYESLFSLIIQVSSKDSKSNETEVGQFGTGFCTTHAFGRTIILNGSLKLYENEYIALDNFVIDRQGESADIVESINRQILKLDELSENREKFVKEIPKKQTSFKYKFNKDDAKQYKDEKRYTHIAIKYIAEYVAYVFALNDVIESLYVKIHVENPEHRDFLKQYETKYTQLPRDNKSDLYPGLYSCNAKDSRSPDRLNRILYIECKEVDNSLFCDILEGTKVLLPLTLTEDKLTGIELPKDFARIFIYFPLIGSEKTWGTSFVMHSPQFTPRTERDGLYLISESTSTQDYKAQNRLIIESTNQIIFDFLYKKANSINQIYNIIHFSFSQDNNLDDELTDIQKDNLYYYKKQQENWQSIIIDLPIVKCKKGDKPYMSIRESSFLSPELFTRPEYKDDVYNIVKIFWCNIPLYENNEFYYWTRALSTWDNSKNSIHWITFENITEELSKYGKIDDSIDKDLLIRFYSYLLSVKEDLFYKRPLLPNLNNNFQTVETLKKNIAIDSYLIEIANELGLTTSECIVQEEFKFSFPFEEYTGKILNKSLSDKKVEIWHRFINDKDSLQLLQQKERKAFIKLCSVFPANPSGLRHELMPHICCFWNVDFIQKELKGLGEENRIYYDDTFLPFLIEDTLIDLQLKDKDWNERNQRLILDIVKCAYKLASLTELLKKYPCFINQNYELKKNDELFYEEKNISPELKELYNEVFSKKEDVPSYDIDDILLDKTFYSELSLLKDPNKKVVLFFSEPKYAKDASALATEINHVFEQEKITSQSKSILTNKYKEQVLGIIQNIASENNEEQLEKYWSNLFPSIEKEKAELFLESAGDSKQGVIFNIMRQDDQTINAIASMIDNPRLLKSLKDENSVDLMEKLSENPIELDYLLYNIHNISIIIQDAKEADNRRKEEQAHRDHIKDIGENIQNKILSVLQGYEFLETYDNNKIEDEQGGQDFIIRKNGQDVYFIEVKSRWNSSTAIRLSKRQSEKAFHNPNKYAVITVDLSQRSDRSNYFPEFSDFEPYIRVLVDAGSKVESIKSPDITPEEILRINDYSSTIQQSQFEKGCSFNQFVDFLKEYLKNNYL